MTEKEILDALFSKNPEIIDSAVGSIEEHCGEWSTPACTPDCMYYSICHDSKEVEEDADNTGSR